MQKGKLYTRKLIAEILCLSEKRVKQLTEDGVINEFSHGHYKLLPAIQGYIKYLQSQVLDGGADYNSEKANLTRLKREDAELDLQIKRGELHRVADVEFIIANMLVAFRSKLQTLPYKVLPQVLSVPDGENKADYIANVLKNEVSEALTELSNYDPNVLEVDEDFQ